MQTSLHFLTIVKVGPSIVSLDDEVGIVQHSKSIDNVGAEVWIYVFRLVFSNSRPVPCPVGEVADDLIRSKGYYLLRI